MEKKMKLSLEELDTAIEADPECKKEETESLMIIRSLFFGRELMEREAQHQRRVLAEGICKDPGLLEDAVIPLSEAVTVLVGRLENMKNNYLQDARENEPTAEDAYDYAHQFLIYHAIMVFLENVIEQDCDYYLHLCDLGCAAVRKRMEKEEERKHGA